MAEKFKVNRGLESIIKQQNKNSGNIWFSEDGQNLYIDSKDGQKRIQITDVIDLSVESKDGNYYPNKIYISNDDNYTLKKYDEKSKQLVTISNLENKVLESNNAFVYDANDSAKATITDSTIPKKGTIIVDKNNDVGIVTKVENNNIQVLIIANNNTKNILNGNDIYFDSNYEGQQVGTFDYPFSDINELYTKCTNLLSGTSLTTIHLKSNSEFNGNSDIECNIRNTIFVSDKSAKIYCRTFNNHMLNDVTFSNVIIESQGMNIVSYNNVLFDNCTINDDLILSNCENLFIKNSIINSDINLNKTCNITIENTSINGSLKSHRCEECEIHLVNSSINDLEFTESKANIHIYNANIMNSIDVTANSIYFHSGTFVGDSFHISVDKYYLGTFDFSNIIPDINGNEQLPAGLSSTQVYDKTIDRKYGTPENSTLKAHLDKISESIDNLNDKLSGTDSLVNAFITKDTFTSQDDLIGEFRTGDVLTYVNESSTNLNFKFNLVGINYEEKTEYDYDNMKYMGSVDYYDDLPLDVNNDEVYSVTYNKDDSSSNLHYKYIDGQWEEVMPVDFVCYYFELENAAYYAKFNDVIDLVDYSTIKFKEDVDITIAENSYLKIPVFDVKDNKITIKIKKEKLLEIISTDIFNLTNGEFLEQEYLLLAEYVYANFLNTLQNNSIFNQMIKVSHKDRIIRLTNGWDKLSGSTDNANGNYHIVSTYGALPRIDNDATRKVGILAYVEDEDMMYQWKYIDETQTTKAWLEFSSGSSGGSRARITLYGEPDLYREDSSNITFQVQVSNCSTGMIKASYQFAGAAETKRTVEVSVPYVGIYDVTLMDIADRSGLLNVSVSFISSDENVESSSSSVNLTFFIGNLLHIDSDSFYIKQSYNSNRKYNVGIGESKNIDVANLDTLTDSLELNYDVSTKNDDNFMVYFTLYKNNEIVTTFESEPTNVTANYKLVLPKKTSIGTIIDYSPGYYRIEAYAKDITFTSNTVSYEFILENSNPVIVLLNNKEMHVDPTDYVNLHYIIICNTDTMLTFTVSPLIHSVNDNYTNYAKIVENSEVSYSDILIAQSISFTQVNCKENERYLTGLQLISSIGNDVTSYLSIFFENKNYMSIVQSSNYKLLFNLDSRNKSNNTSDRVKWDSSLVSNNDICHLYNFSYFDDGWIPKITDDSGTTTVLASDGYATYATLNVNPMYKYSDNSIFNCEDGFTFEIKFKYNELYKDGAIIECINDENKGFIIKGNKVIWSPYVNIDSADNSNACISRLTTDTWHDINFVLATKTNDKFYKTYMYNGLMSGNSIAMLFIDGVLVSLIDGGAQSFYSENDSQTRMITLFAQYDYTNHIAQNFVKGEIMHIRCYNNALTPDEILTNYIANAHIIDKQLALKNLNDYYEGVNSSGNKIKEFGYSSSYQYTDINGNSQMHYSALPKLTISNANLSSMDSIMGPTAKNYLFPNVGLKLEINDKILMERYGSVCKCQGTSSTNYAIKNYKITFYDVSSPLDNSAVYDTSKVTYYSGDSIHPNSYNTMIADDDNYKRYKYTNNDETNGVKLNKEKVSINGWLSESTFTLKADYMDSSHTHNTGTAKFVNDYLPLIPPQAENSPYDDPTESTKISYSIDEIKAGDYSQSTINAGQNINPRTKIRQAIDGFPCLVVYEYEKEGKIETIPKGIYQFNVDKNANNVFGYGEYQNCKSYEISNNSTTSDLGAAGFDINILDKSSNTYETDPLYAIKRDFEIRYHPNEELNEDNIDLNIEYIKDNWKLNEDSISFNKDEEYILVSNNVELETLTEILTYYQSIMDSRDLYNSHYGYLPINDENGNLKLIYSKHALNSDDETLRLGLTYIDDYTYKKNDIDHHQHDELKHLFMWLRDCKTGTRDFIKDFDTHFNKTNVERYIILVRLLGMVDNLAKNMMITSWNCDKENVTYLYDELGEITGIDYDNSTFCTWHLQFYDLDTSLGLTNDGHNTLNTSIDIYGHDRTTDLIVEDGEDKELCEDITETTYNASNSLLWKLVLDNFGRLDYSGKSGTGYYSLQGTYRQLRLDTLTPEKIKNNYFNNITNKIGQHYYNFDALNKYFGWNFSDGSIRNNYFYMCQGSAKEHMSDWIDKRFIYIDSLYATENGQIKDRPNLGANEAVVNKNIGVSVKAPMYLPVQFADVNTLNTAQLCTSECYNLINCSFESDANIIFYQVRNILSLRGLGIFNFTSLGLNAATSLVELNCSDLPNLSSLEIGSTILQKLNLANSKLTNIDVSKLTNLIDLDISNSNIENIIFSSNMGNAYNIKTLNVANSKLKDLNFETLTSLESFGKVNLSTDTAWNTYDKLINQIRYYQLAGDTNNGYNDSEYMQKELEYVQKLVNTFKSVLKSEGKLSAFNAAINSNLDYDSSDYYDILKFIMNVTTYRNILAQQYIPNLAILTDITSSYKNVVFNSDKIRAIIFTSTKDNFVFGTDGGSINISSDNLKYLEINRSNIGSGNLLINNPNISYLKLNNCNYSGILDLSKASKLKTIDLSLNKKLTDIIYSPELAGNNTLEVLNLSNDYELKSFSSNVIDAKDDYYIFDMTNFENLKTFKILDVIKFKELKGLSLNISSSNRNNIDMSVTCSSNKTLSMVEEVKNLGYTTSISGSITLTNTTNLNSLFSGRQNWEFDKNTFKINGLNYCNSLYNTFNLCQTLTYEYVTYILENISSTCTNLSYTFRGCSGIKFPGNIVSKSLFNKCTGVLTTEGMFGNIGRDSLNNLNSLSLYAKLTLEPGVFDNLISCENILCMFNDCMSGITYGSDTTGYTSIYTHTAEQTQLITNNIYIYDSYIGKFNIDLFDKMKNLTNIGLGDTRCGTIFNSTKDNTTMICTRNNNSNRDFNTIFAKINNYNMFKNMFTKTMNIKYDNNESISINGKIFAKYDNNDELTSLKLENETSNNIIRMFANMNTQLTIEFNNLFEYLEGSISCEGLFYKYSKPFTFSPLLINSEKLKITSMAFMYAYCSNMTGYLFNTENRGDYTYNDVSYADIHIIDDKNCFSNQNSITSTCGMFYECNSFGGLTKIKWEDMDEDGMNDIITGQEKVNDLPYDLFDNLSNLEDSSYMFYGCKNMNIWFDELYNKDENKIKYMFKSCEKLLDISYMFANCLGLIHELPTYGAKGSQLNDYKYVYYNITDSVNKWLNTLTPNDLDYGKDSSKVKYPEDYEFNESTELENRIYNYKLISNWSTFANKYKMTYTRVYNDIDNVGNVIGTNYEFYQYYKECDIIDENIQYLGDNNSNHKSYVDIPGLFCNYNGSSNSSLKNVAGVFSGCSNLIGQIPSNIFRRMSNVTSVAYFFNNCNNIGTTNDFLPINVRPNHETGAIEVRPPYIYPYSLFDDMINLTTIKSCFKNISLLSRPFKTLSYRRSEELINGGINETIGSTNIVDEIYALPKYLLYFNTKLTDISEAWYNNDADTHNELFGLIYPYQFVKNINITNMAYAFNDTNITGSKVTTYNNSNMQYIGSSLFSTLKSLNDVRGMFGNTRNLRYLVNPNSRDLIFDTSIHGRYMITVGFVDSAGSSNSGCWEQVFGEEVKGKIVKNNNATTFDKDYQCYQYFTDIVSDYTLTPYIK